jgi:hypothetical protein
MAAPLILIIIGILILLVFMLASHKTVQDSDAMKNEKFYSKVITSLPEPGKSALLMLKEAWYNNVAADRVSIDRKMDFPATVDTKNLDAKEAYLKINGIDSAEDIYRAFLMDLDDRYRLEFKPLPHTNKEEAFSRYKIHLHENEILYHWIRGTELYEQKVSKRIEKYSGYEFGIGAHKSGQMTYVTEEIKDFAKLDNGWLYFTNARIIYIGRRNNIMRTYGYERIVTVKLYQDGILLGMDDGSLGLMKFDGNHNWDVGSPHYAFFTNDGVNQFIRVFHRILHKTQDIDLSNTL